MLDSYEGETTITKGNLSTYKINKSLEYQKLMAKHGWNKADLARHLGVSRAWVTIVMRELG